MKNTKILGALILGIFLVGTISIAAEDIGTIPNNVPFSFGSWFQHTFNIQDYSIVGDSRQCSRYADDTLYFYTEGDIALMNVEGSDYCSSGYALLDVFVDNWKPYKEYKNDLNSFCDSDNEKCIVEVYCCDYDECDDDNDCEDWYGAGSQCETESANDPNIDYKYSTFKYCTEPGDIETKCYYDTGAGTCSGTRTYIGDTNCPETYMNYNLYESKSDCLENEKCSSHSSSKCYSDDIYWHNSCGNREDKMTECGTIGCVTGASSCKTNDVVLDCTDFIKESDCLIHNECDWVYADSWIIDKHCITKSNGDAGEIMVSKIELPNPNLENYRPEIERTFSVKLENTGSSTKTVFVEAGFYTNDYAQDDACLFSIGLFNLFSTVGPAPNCAGNEGFVKTKKVTLNPGDSETIKIEQSPLYAYVTLNPGITYILADIDLVSFLGVYETCCQRISADPCSGCVEGTGGYIGSKYDPTFGTNEYSGLGKSSITCGGEVYGEIDYNFFDKNTIRINKDYRQCISYTFYTQNGTVNQTLTLENKFKLQDIKKLALTKDQAKKATSSDLLTSACLTSSECGYIKVDEEEYDVSCISISKLREDDVISEATEDNFFDNAGTIIKGTSYGAAGGVLACGIGWATAGFIVGGPAGAAVSVVSLLANPATVGGCGAVGALLGGTGTVAYLDVAQDDDLLEALEAKNSDAVGICIKESKGNLDEFFSWASWFDITGDGRKTGEDGLIIFIILVALGVVLIRR